MVGNGRGRAQPPRGIRERRTESGAGGSRALRETIHAVVIREGSRYTGECLEVAIVTQGGTLEETVANLREAIGLHLEGEDPAALGLVPEPRLVVTYEEPTLLR